MNDFADIYTRRVQRIRAQDALVRAAVAEDEAEALVDNLDVDRGLVGALDQARNARRMAVAEYRRVMA